MDLWMSMAVGRSWQHISGLSNNHSIACIDPEYLCMCAKLHELCMLIRMLVHISCIYILVATCSRYFGKYVCMCMGQASIRFEVDDWSTPQLAGFALPNTNNTFEHEDMGITKPNIIKNGYINIRTWIILPILGMFPRRYKAWTINECLQLLHPGSGIDWWFRGMSTTSQNQPPKEEIPSKLSGSWVIPTKLLVNQKSIGRSFSA